MLTQAKRNSLKPASAHSVLTRDSAVLRQDGRRSNHNSGLFYPKGQGSPGKNRADDFTGVERFGCREKTDWIAPRLAQGTAIQPKVKLSPPDRCRGAAPIPPLAGGMFHAP